MDELTVGDESVPEEVSEQEASDEVLSEMEKLANEPDLPSLEENFTEFSSEEISTYYSPKWGKLHGGMAGAVLPLTYFGEVGLLSYTGVPEAVPEDGLGVAMAAVPFVAAYASEKALNVADDRIRAKEEKVMQNRERLSNTYVLEEELSGFLSEQDEVLVEGKDWIELYDGEDAAEIYRGWDDFEKLQLFEDLTLDDHVLNYQLEVRLPELDRKMVFYGQDKNNFYLKSYTQVHGGSSTDDCSLYEELRDEIVEQPSGEFF